MKYCSFKKALLWLITALILVVITNHIMARPVEAG